MINPIRILQSIAILSLLSPYLVLAQDLVLQGQPNCELPATTECLVQNSQYTVVGTVVSTTIGQGSDTVARFSIMLDINCVWASYISLSDGAGLVNNRVNVTNWGIPHRGCPANTGSNTTVGFQGIFFIYVAKAAPRGAPPSQATFATTAICAGPANLTDAKVVAQVLQDSVDPANAISAQNRGTASFCNLPTIQTATATAPLATGTSKSNAAAVPSSAMGVFALFLFSSIMMSF